MTFTLTPCFCCCKFQNCYQWLDISFRNQNRDFVIWLFSLRQHKFWRQTLHCSLILIEHWQPNTLCISYSDLIATQIGINHIGKGYHHMSGRLPSMHLFSGKVFCNICMSCYVHFCLLVVDVVD